MNTTFINPFEKSELISLSSGIKAGKKVADDFLRAKEIGKREMKNFIEERLVKGETSFFTVVKE